MFTRKLILFRRWCAIAFSVTALTLSAGCQTGPRPATVDGVNYVQRINQRIDAPVAQVLKVTGLTLRDFNLHEIRADTTKLDGQFRATSALGTRFIIIVRPLSQEATSFQVWVGGRFDQEVLDMLVREVHEQSSIVGSQPASVTR